MGIDILEARHIQFCECKVAAMVNAGQLLRFDGELYYSETKRSLDELHTAHDEGFLKLVTSDMALSLGLASEHWKAISVAPEGFNTSSKDYRVKYLRNTTMLQAMETTKNPMKFW